MKKTTLVIGASLNTERYSNKAIKSLRHHDFPVIAYGLKNGMVGDVSISTSWNENWDVDTVTLYVQPERQVALYSAIIHLKPRRVIFNPGTENPEFQQLLLQSGIQFENACTLILLSIHQYA
jgi:predicted CoA-binding protein